MVLNRAEASGTHEDHYQYYGYSERGEGRTSRKSMIRFLVHRVRARSLALAACETALMIAAVVVAAALRFGLRRRHRHPGARERDLQSPAHRRRSPRSACTTRICTTSRVASDRRELYTRLIQALASTSFALAVLYFWFPSLMVGRGVFLIAAVLVIDDRRRLAPGLRVAERPGRTRASGCCSSARARPRSIWRASSTSSRHELGVEIAGFIDPDPAKVGTSLLNPGIIGTIEDIPRIVRAHGVDRVVVSLADARGTLPMDKLLEMKLEGVAFDHLASVYEQYTGKIAVENLRPSWLIFSDGFRKSRFLGTMKRAMDVACAVAGPGAGSAADG